MSSGVLNLASMMNNDCSQFSQWNEFWKMRRTTYTHTLHKICTILCFTKAIWLVWFNWKNVKTENHFYKTDTQIILKKQQKFRINVTVNRNLYWNISSVLFFSSVLFHIHIFVPMPVCHITVIRSFIHLVMRSAYRFTINKNHIHLKSERMLNVECGLLWPFSKKEVCFISRRGFVT